MTEAQAAEPPARMRHLPMRGRFPVPPIFGVDDAGVPDFTVLDSKEWLRLVTEHACHMCGERLEWWCFFIGGDRSIHNRMFQDGAMHRECAEYALRVCPFLAQGRSYTDRPARTTQGRGDSPISDTTNNPGRFGLYRTRGYRLRAIGESLAIEAQPAAEVQWWRDGEPE